ncbi:MAG: RCC1 repeat-containing protein, partial [bacterium (Candidatus Ratteibacteria) CG23_combo_of_CG06-09_8_20_14_all_48_7]
GGYHSLGLQSDGSLWVWGRNLEYQLGDGTTLGKNVPTCIEGGNTWTAVAGGVYHSVGIRSDGTLWSWGGNSYGQLGDGTNVTRYVPTQIG